MNEKNITPEDTDTIYDYDYELMAELQAEMDEALLWDI